jgi:hypothetical protein
MTKFENRELAKLNALANVADVGYLARSYSALIRSTRTSASHDHMLDCAQRNPAVVAHPEFIIA